MTGKYKMVKSEGCNEFMTEMGVGGFKRNILCSASPVLEISQNDADEIQLTTRLPVKTVTRQFKLGELRQHTVPITGRTVSAITRLEGNKLVSEQTIDKGDTTTLTNSEQEFLSGGNKMTATIYIQDKPSVRMVREFERV